MAKPSFIKFIPGIVWFFVVLVLICLPKKDLPELDYWGSFFYKIHFDKWVHAGMFGLLALFFMIPFAKTKSFKSSKIKVFVLVALLTMIWGLATEFIQLTVPGRSFDLADWYADCAGVMLALVTALRVKEHI